MTSGLQLRADVGTLGSEKPGGAPPRVLVGQDQGPDVVELVIGQAGDGCGRGDGAELRGEGGDGGSVVEVELGHLHVAGALAGATGGGVVVDVELEVAGLEGNERQHRRELLQ